MSKFSYFEYRMPQFVTPEGYSKEAFIADTLRFPYSPEEPARSWKVMSNRHPWLKNQLFPKSAGAHSVVKSVIREENASASVPFRPSSREWHIDGPSFGEKIAILRTACPTIFASCIAVINVEEYKEQGFSGNPAGPVRGLTRAFGADWLEQAAGLSECNPVLRRVMPGVQDLEVEQAPVDMIAVGDTAVTLHRSADRKPDDPEFSVIARALYDLPQVA